MFQEILKILETAEWLYQYDINYWAPMLIIEGEQKARVMRMVKRNFNANIFEMLEKNYIKNIQIVMKLSDREAARFLNSEYLPPWSGV